MKVQINVDQDLWRQAKAIAALNHLTLSEFVCKSVRNLLVQWGEPICSPPTTSKVTTSFSKSP